MNQCEHKTTVKIRSQNIKMCFDCEENIPWPLESGEVSTLEHNKHLLIRDQPRKDNVKK